MKKIKIGADAIWYTINVGEVRINPKTGKWIKKTRMRDGGMITGTPVAMDTFWSTLYSMTNTMKRMAKKADPTLMYSKFEKPKSRHRRIIL